MFAKTLEALQSSAQKQAIYTRWILATLGICVAFKAVWFSRLGIWHDRNLVDFDAFHIIAQRVWRGDVDQAYQVEKLIKMQREVSGGIESFMPWTYPPQFALLVAPFGLLPVGIAYFLFTAATLAFYLTVLRSIAANHFLVLAIILFPAIQLTIACGQNGFLTAGLIGLVCLFIESRPILAGVALGLMVIKPHLAIAFAAYAIMARHWVVVMIAAAVVLVTSLLCTAVFGFQIWIGLLQSVHDSAGFLVEGYYPLYRMISSYAGLRTMGASASIAFSGQAVVAALALGAIALALYRGFPVRCRLGLTAMISISISPYAYDYDFLIFGIGLAMLLPELMKVAQEGERDLFYILPIIVGAYGSLRSARLGTSHPDVQCLDVLSIGGFAVVLLIALTLRILLRGSKLETARLGFDPGIAPR